MVRIALAFLAGILWVETRASLDPVAAAAPLLFLVVLVCGCWRPKWLAMLAAGVLWAGLRAELALDARTWDDSDREDRLVTGVVVSIPENSADRVQFDFEPEGGLPRRLRVSWYKESGEGDGTRMPR